MLRTIITIACIGLALAPADSWAQRGNERRLYCWEESGRKVCGDALPASAVDAARTEISAATGAVRSRVDRALTPEERAEAEAQARRAAEQAEAEAAARRRDIAMVESYSTEADLERAYDNRIILIDESIKTSRMGVANLRLSLLTQLRQAAEAELDGRAVGKPLLQNITSQHADLMRQQAILQQQLREREEVDASLQEARERYRSLTRAE
ncbi:MAG: hypothetical protein GX538_05990 [Gammaproteobacteria bacterium]|nr:hypothetical protein [Gammaproteobacteria bacterium]